MFKVNWTMFPFASVVNAKTELQGNVELLYFKCPSLGTQEVGVTSVYGMFGRSFDGRTSVKDGCMAVVSKFPY